MGPTFRDVLASSPKLWVLLYTAPGAILLFLLGAAPPVALIAALGVAFPLLMRRLSGRDDMPPSEGRAALLFSAGLLAWAVGVQVLTVVRGLSLVQCAVLALAPLFLIAFVALPVTAVLMTWRAVQRLRGARPVTEDDMPPLDALWLGALAFLGALLPLSWLAGATGHAGAELGAFLVALGAGLTVGRGAYVRLSQLAERRGLRLVK